MGHGDLTYPHGTLFQQHLNFSGNKVISGLKKFHLYISQIISFASSGYNVDNAYLQIIMHQALGMLKDYTNTRGNFTGLVMKYGFVHSLEKLAFLKAGDSTIYVYISYNSSFHLLHMCTWCQCLREWC